MTVSQPVNYKHKFQALRRLTKDLAEQKGRGLLLQELFAGQGWYLASLKQKLLDNRKKEALSRPPSELTSVACEERESGIPSPSIPLEEIIPSEMDTTLSALEAFATTNISPVITREMPPKNEIQTTFNTTIKIAAGMPMGGTIIRFNVDGSVFRPMPLDLKDEKGVDLLVVGSPEKESHGRAENNLLEEKWLLLGKILKSMGLDGQDVAFSLGVDFDEQTKEIKHDRFYREFRLLRPKLLLALGATASNMLLLRRERLSQIHGQIFSNELQFSDGHGMNCFFMPIYHPDFLLINPNMKRATWEDIKQAMLFLKTPS